MNKAATVTLLLLCCGRPPPLITPAIGGARVTLDAGHGHANTCTVPFGGPACCSSAGLHVASAACSADGAYVCSEGSVCACAGRPQTFWCTDVCGSDAYVTPDCGPDGWLCPGGLIATDSCPAGTCWGEPGDGCTCVDGQWDCPSHDPI